MPNRLIVLRVALLLFSLAAGGCTPADTSKPPASETKRAPFIGEITPVVSVQELMAHMIDPAADYIFDAVWWDSTSKGIVEHKPVTEEDWEKVETGAITIIEGVELLKVPRPFAPRDNSIGPNPLELSPAQIKEKIDKDPVVWIAKIQALRNVGLEVLAIVKEKDVDKLFKAGGDLDTACESCHLEYWYPGAKTTYRHTP